MSLTVHEATKILRRPYKAPEQKEEAIEALESRLKEAEGLLVRAKEWVGVDLVNYNEDEGDRWFSDLEAFQAKGAGR